MLFLILELLICTLIGLIKGSKPQTMSIQTVLDLIKTPNLHNEIQGHTDNIGSNLDNRDLSNQRAKAVYDYLIIKVKNKLSYTGYGESKPLVSNESENGRGLNRRTSFIIQ